MIDFSKSLDSPDEAERLWFKCQKNGWPEGADASYAYMSWLKSTDMSEFFDEGDSWVKIGMRLAENVRKSEEATEMVDVLLSSNNLFQWNFDQINQTLISCGSEAPKVLAKTCVGSFQKKVFENYGDMKRAKAACLRVLLTRLGDLRIWRTDQEEIEHTLNVMNPKQVCMDWSPNMGKITFGLLAKSKPGLRAWLNILGNEPSSLDRFDLDKNERNKLAHDIGELKDINHLIDLKSGWIEWVTDNGGEFSNETFSVVATKKILDSEAHQGKKRQKRKL